MLIMFTIANQHVLSEKSGSLFNSVVKSLVKITQNTS